MAAFEPSLRANVAQFLKAPHRLLIGGSWVEARSGRTFVTCDPGAGRAIAEVSEAAAEDVDAAVAAARRAFEEGAWSRLTPADRSKVIWRLADLFDQNADDLAELEALNNGMPLFIARHSVSSSAELLRYFAGWATKIAGDTLTPSAPGAWHAYTVREPMGVVGQIIPWNAPIGMAVWKIAPALAAGCTIVLKPAEQTPLTALWLGRLIAEAGFPEGVVNIVPGPGETAGAALAAHPDVDKIAFTGSTATGRAIVNASTGNLKRVSLELGGKAPMIVFPDADIERAIPGLTMGAFVNSGQVCAAGTRLYAHRKVFDRVVEGVTQQAAKFRIGHGLAPETTLGPLVSKAQLERVSGYVSRGMKEGARVLSGGGEIAGEGYFYPPTFLLASPQTNVMREEIFGPVLCVRAFGDDDIDDIAREANNTAYGLAASVWTKDLSTAHRMARKIKAGSIGVNTHVLTDPALPFGGFKQSGWGREKGREALDLYTEIKAVGMAL